VRKTDQARWDDRYADSSPDDVGVASVWLTQHIARISPGYALDIACGKGRHSIFLAQQGFDVDAVDVSPVGINLAQRAAQSSGVGQSMGSITWHCQDLLETTRLPRQEYQLIVMSYFIAADLLARLPGYLATGGWLLVEEHMCWHTPVAGPSSDKFRVSPGALLRVLSNCNVEIAAQSEGLVERPGQPPYALSRLLVRRV